jgi:hypothetical protein
MAHQKTRKEATERRKKLRFPIQRELRYKLLEGSVVVETGTGRTIDIGSAGVKFALDRHLTPGACVELGISWPVLLDASCAMRLVVFGRVLRSDGTETVCNIEKHEFRTQGRVLQTVQPLIRRDTRLERWANEVQKAASA